MPTKVVNYQDFGKAMYKYIYAISRFDNKLFIGYKLPNIIMIYVNIFYLYLTFDIIC